MSLHRDYKSDKGWEETLHIQMRLILGSLMHLLASINVASTEKDRSYATDFELTLVGGAIAARVRRPGCKFRDLTIRALRKNGAKTELAKIQEGYAYRYFYGWSDEQGEIPEWILVDLDKLRTSGLLEKKRRYIPNDDGETFFIAIPVKELEEADCILASQLTFKQSAIPAKPVISTEQNKRGFNYFKKQTRTIEETYSWCSDDNLFALEDGIAEADRIWQEREGK